MNLTNEQLEYNSDLTSQDSALSDRIDELATKAWDLHTKLGKGYSGVGAQHRQLKDMVKMGEQAKMALQVIEAKSAIMSLYVSGVRD